MRARDSLLVRLAATVVFALAFSSAGRAQITWDANATGAGQTDGAGAWLGANQWWNGTTNVTWNSSTPDSAIIGNGGVGGAITLGGNVTAGGISLNNFTGTYTIQGSSHSLTQTGSITIGGTGNVTFRGTGTSALLALSGTGGITMNGTGLLTMRENITTNYTGQTTINSGTVMINAGVKPTGNFSLNGGMLTDYFQQTGHFTSGLGAGANQVQISGDSGFGAGNGNSTWRIGTAGSVLVWGATGEGSATGFFNPTTLKFLAPGVDNMGPTIYGRVTLDNGLNLNGATRTIDVAAATGTNAQSVTGGVVNSGASITGELSGTGSGSVLLKTGGGNLTLSGGNTYAGGTTISNGMVRFVNKTSMPNSGTVSVNSGATLGVDVNGGTGWGSGAGNGGVAGLTNGFGGQAGATVTFAGNSSLWLNVTANTTESSVISNGGATNLAINKQGSATLTLSGNNTYTGVTTVGAGVLQFAKQTSLYNNTTGSWTAANLNVRSGGTLAFSVGGAGEFTTGDVTTLMTNLASSASATSGMNSGSVFGFDTTNASGGAFTIADLVANSAGTSGGSRGLAKFGTGTLALTNTANTYSGVTSVSGGVLEVNRLATGSANSSIGNPNSTAAGNLLLSNGTTLRFVGDGIGTDTTNRNFTINGTAAGHGATLDASGAGTETISFTSTSSPAYGTNNQTRTLTLAGTNTGNNSLAANIANNGSGAVSLTKTGVGTWVLSGTNTYTGATTVNAGTLLVNGNQSAATGAITVANTAALGGIGTVGGATTVQNGGRIFGGDGSNTGTLTTRSVTINSGGLWDVQYGSGSAASQLDASASGSILTLNNGAILNPIGTLDGNSRVIAKLATGTGELVVNGTAIEGNGDIAVFEYASGSGVQDFGTSGLKIDITGLSLAAGDKFTLSRNDSDLVLIFTPVPEPGAMLAVCGGVLVVGVLVRRVRRREIATNAVPA